MSKIEWTDETINPIVGCSKISEGCLNCYAEKMAWRMAHNPKLSGEVRSAYQSVVSNGKWNGKVAFVSSAFDKLKTLKKPKRIFVGSMCDIFYNRSFDEKWNAGFRYPAMEWIERIVSDIAFYEKHTFMFLTKRSDDMRSYFENHRLPDNLWLGVTVESQKYLSRIDDLLKIPAKVRFISVEPMLSEVIIPQDKLRQLQWVICGNEKTQNGSARYNAEENIISLANQCAEAGVPFFFKSWGGGCSRIDREYFAATGCQDGFIDGVEYRQFPKGELV